MEAWITKNALDLIQTVAIVGSLLFTAYTVRTEGWARRIGNSIAINGQYHQIWREVYEHPKLSRVLDKKADLEKEPVSVQEELFVLTLILHLSTVYEAMKHGEFVSLEGLQRDIREFFSLPIPKAVWIKTKLLQNQDFAAFIESALK